jgi:DNA polymerase-1
MRTVAIDLEYDYLDPFLCTTTDDELKSRLYRLKVLSQKKEVKVLCERRDVRKIFHHATGDVFQLRNIGIKVINPIECTLIASNLVDENYKSRNLKKLAQVHLGIETKEANRLKSTIVKYKKLAEKGGYQFKWSQIPDEVMFPYARCDPDMTLKLWYYWQTPLQESLKLYEFEKSIMPLIVDIQLKGLRVDRYRCKRVSNEYGRKLEVLYDNMSKYLVDNKIVLGKDFNPRSVPQIQDIILQLGMGDEEAGGDSDRIDLKTRMPKTDKVALQKLSLDNKFFGMVQKNRFFTKHKGTYYDPLYEYYTSEKDDNAHFLMYQTGAKTGRFSVELAQTFPKPEENKLAGESHEVRKCLIPRRGKVFLCKDYEQQEARLFCHYSKSQRMIDIINKNSGVPGFDIYIPTGELLFGSSFDVLEWRKLLRFVAKTDFLGAIYGEGRTKLIKSTVAMLYDKFDREIVEGIGVNEQWASESLQRFYELYPVREYMNEKMKELYSKGYIELEFNSRLMNFKRRYNIPREFAYKCPNAVIQGTAAYVIKHAMLRCTERIKRERWQGRVDMILQVHDELIFEVDNNISFIKEVDQVMGEEMNDLETFSVPITTSGKWSDKSWGDVIKL